MLEATFLVHRLPAWSGNFGKRLVKAPKLFLCDTGLAANLLGGDEERLAGDPMLCGRVLENFVVSEVLKQIGWSRTKPGIYHLRTQTGCEVDLVLEDSRGRCAGIEIKAGSAGPGEIRGLKEFKRALGKRFVRGIVFYTGGEIIPFAKNIHAVPVNALWK